MYGWMDRLMDRVVFSSKVATWKWLFLGPQPFYSVCHCRFRIQGALVLLALRSSLNALTFDLNCELVCLESVDTLNAAFGFREKEYPPLGHPDVSLHLCLCAYTVDVVREKRSAYLTMFSYILFLNQSHVLKNVGLQPCIITIWGRLFLLVLNDSNHKTLIRRFTKRWMGGITS